MVEFEYKGKVHTVCTCECHVEGRSILHFAPCCRFTYQTYLIKRSSGPIVMHGYHTFEMIAGKNVKTIEPDTYYELDEEYFKQLIDDTAV